MKSKEKTTISQKAFIPSCILFKFLSDCYLHDRIPVEPITFLYKFNRMLAGIVLITNSHRSPIGCTLLDKEDDRNHCVVLLFDPFSPADQHIIFANSEDPDDSIWTLD